MALTACQGGQTAPKPSPSPSGPPTETTTVALRHVPTGVATFYLDSQAQAVGMELSLTGLAPKTSHPVHLHQGACGNGGAVLATVDPVTADEHGNVSLTTTFDSLKAVPRLASLEVHVGPDVTSSTGAPAIVCGEVVATGATGRVVGRGSAPTPTPSASAPASASTSATTVTAGPPAVAFAELYSAPARGTSPVGSATLTLDRVAKTLTVSVTTSGLAPGSHHPNHVHAGSCESQGKVLFPLDELTADDFGNASASTVIKNVTDIAYGAWYVNVHQGPSLADQAGFTPVECGDVVRTGPTTSISPSPSPTPSEAPSASPSSSPSVRPSPRPTTPAVAPTASKAPVASPSAAVSPSPTR